jgi:hypothetical protein
MAKRKAKASGGAGARRPATGAPAGIRLEMESVGERKNYNFQPGVTEYRLWPFSTIEWVVDQSRYRARAIVQHTTGRNLVAFNSWHQDFADAERAIALVSDSLNGVGDRRVYNIFGEVIDLHTADIGGGPPVRVTEVLALIWSMRES